MQNDSQRPIGARSSRRRWVPILAALTLSFGVSAACQSAYYSAMEKFGVHKREILVDRVKDAREDQKEAKELFVSTFDQFKSLTKFDGGELEQRYKKLNADYEDCSSKAEVVRKRIKSVEDVAEALFTEWQAEIGQIQNPEIKRNSTASLDATKVRYGELRDAMKKASAGMDPVLVAFHDHVLALKHNLNAQAISSLSSTVTSIQNDVSSLIENMQRSIQEADSFINAMGKS
ncbi:MAG: DUF2959 domain-containing protein [Planctomycetes bacterium]|nr:DUF2959 domain-containing protein [Planctomycetota bacterium]